MQVKKKGKYAHTHTYKLVLMGICKPLVRSMGSKIGVSGVGDPW